MRRRGLATRVVAALSLVLVGAAAAATTSTALTPPAAMTAPATSAPASQFGADPQGTYRPITPFRAKDILNLGPNQTGTVHVAEPGHALPSGTPFSVVANVTVANASRSTFVTVFPHGTARPGTSNLNLRPIDSYISATEVVLPVSADGSLDVYNADGNVVVLVDVLGYYPNGPSFVPVTPSRLLDTRPGSQTSDGVSAGAGALRGGSSLSVHVSGRAGVPGQGVAGVYATLTSVSPTLGTYVSAYPGGAPAPLASVLNPAAGVTTANLVFVPLGADGSVSIFNATGSTDVLLDVVGYLASGTTFHSMGPDRFLDTRPGASTFDAVGQGGGRLTADETRSVPVAGRAGIPGSATSVIVNATAVGPTGPSWISMGSSAAEGWSPLSVSTLNPIGAIATNLAIVPLDIHGNLSVYNNQGSVDLILDVVGWSDAAVDPHIRLLSKNAEGSFPHGSSYTPVISRDASTVVYASTAVDGPGGGHGGVVVANRVSGAHSLLTSSQTSGPSPLALSDAGTAVALSTMTQPDDPNAPAQAERIFSYSSSTQAWTMTSPVKGYPIYQAPTMSGDGRYVAYTDESTSPYAYVTDRQTGTTTPLLTNSAGYPVPSLAPHLSQDARLAVFASPSRLVPDLPALSVWRVFVVDRTSGAVSLVSDRNSTTSIDDIEGVSDDGNVVLYGNVSGTWLANRSTGAVQGLGPVREASLSGDGRFVCFNGVDQFDSLYRYDAVSGQRLLITLSRAGTPASGGGHDCQLSDDGRIAVFSSTSAQYVAGDDYVSTGGSGFQDVFDVDLGAP